MAIKIPDKCRECKHVGAYTSGPYARNPHHCCELIWRLFETEYKVNPDTLDSCCPLKHDGFVKAIEEIAGKLGVNLEDT